MQLQIAGQDTGAARTNLAVSQASGQSIREMSSNQTDHQWTWMFGSGRRASGQQQEPIAAVEGFGEMVAELSPFSHLSKNFSAEPMHAATAVRGHLVRHGGPASASLGRWLMLLHPHLPRRKPRFRQTGGQWQRSPKFRMPEFNTCCTGWATTLADRALAGILRHSSTQRIAT